ncbi:uncharacterized protein V6R79_007231 [Siganus canaliculatus]
MEDHNSSLGTWDYDDSSYLGKALFADSVVTYIVISSGVPLCAVAVYVLYSLVRHGGAPALVYLFNLLISDIVQIICLILIISPLPRLWNLDLVSTIHSFCVVARVAFMVTLSGMEEHSSSVGTWDYDYISYLEEVSLVDRVVNYIVISSGVPLCAVAVYVLYSLVRLGGAPALVYVFNLLISDIVQIICLYVIIRPFDGLWSLYSLFAHIHFFCVVASVAFMVCIAFERYLLVSRPLCFCSKGPTRTSVVVSFLVWILCPVVFVVAIFLLPVLGLIIIGFLFLLFLFCLAATLGALSACRLPADEKRRIVAVLVLVLLIYTLFFLPAIVTLLTYTGGVFRNLAFILIRVTLSGMESHNSSLGTQDYDDSSYLGKALFVDRVMTYIVISSGVPLCAVAVYVLYSLVRHGGAPALVYLFNLLISDIVQIIYLILIISPLPRLWILYSLLHHIQSFCVVASVAFMVCIALERYLLVLWPLWYRFKRPTRTSVVVSVLVWIFCAVVSIVLYFYNYNLGTIIFSILFLLPIPLFIFCLAATLRALSACRLPADEKRRTVAVLVLVLLIHTLFFLPVVACALIDTGGVNPAVILVKLNPLADLVLCVFMRKGAVDKLLASVCCCEMNGGDSSIPSA